ncbi:MAG: tRNA pseudouridine(55) synthase TruB, partial [Gemmatimonadota bacterium]
MGPTSHAIVARARRALGTRKIGHSGTLDPFASGLLLLCVDAATRLSEYLTGLDKSYRTTMRLGQRTDTLDPEGEIVEEDEAWKALDAKRVQETLAGFVGEIQQVPPQYSAKKIGGEAMHRKARRGERVELEPVTRRIEAMELLEVDLPRVRFRIRCSSGTYVRALARDLGKALGSCAHLLELRRTGIGGFRVEDAVSLDDLDDPESVRRSWISPRDALAHLPS